MTPSSPVEEPTQEEVNRVVQYVEKLRLEAQSRAWNFRSDLLAQDYRDLQTTVHTLLKFKTLNETLTNPPEPTSYRSLFAKGQE